MSMGRGCTPGGGPGLPCGPRGPRCCASVAAGRIAKRTMKKVAFLVVCTVIGNPLGIMDWKSSLILMPELGSGYAKHSIGVKRIVDIEIAIDVRSEQAGIEDA